VPAVTGIMPSLATAEGGDVERSIPVDHVVVAQLRFFGNSSYGMY
jgi:hypothetical protein